MQLQFRHVLVLERQAVEEIVCSKMLRMVLVFHLRDHLFAAARIARNGVDADGIVGRQQARIAQRADKRNCTGRIAARIGDEARLGNAFTLTFGQFGETIGPVRVHAMSSRSINDTGRVMAFEQGNRFLGSIIRQAQDRNIGCAQIVGAQVLVAPLGFRNGDHFKIVAFGQTGADLQASGAVFAINEDFRFHAFCL